MTKTKIVPGDNRKTTALDRIRESYDTGKKLRKNEEILRDKLDVAYSLLVKHPRASVVKILCSKYAVGKVTANKYVNDSLDLFGEVMNSSRQGQRQIIAANLERIAQKAEKEGLYGDAINAHKIKAKVLGLDEEDEVDLNEKLKMPSIIILSSDPSLLNQVQDIPYEQG